MSGERASSQVDQTTLLRTHYALQTGSFVSINEEVPGGIAAFSSVSAAPVWNHAAWMDGDLDTFGPFLDQARMWHSHRERRPAVYLVEPTSHQLDILQNHGYEIFDKEAWLIRKAGGDASLNVKEVSKREEIAAFARAFESCFAARESGYAKALGHEKAGMRHFILYASLKPVAIGTLAWNETLACIYNLGTIPEARRKGYAREMVSHLLAAAETKGCRSVFLQVEDFSHARKLYESAGFKLAFVRHGFQLKDWTVPADEGRVLSRLFPFRGERGIGQVCREMRPLPTEVVQALSSLEVESVSETVIGAWAYLLHRYTGQEEVKFRFRGFGEITAKTLNITISHYAPVQTWLGEIRRDRSGTANGLAVETSVALVSVLGGAGSAAQNLPLEVQMDGPKPTSIQIAYRADLFDKEVVRRMAVHLLQIFQSIVAGPQKLVRDLEILPDAERNQLLVGWNSSNFTSVNTTVAKLFEEQVERAPEAVALIVAGGSKAAEQLSYRQLNRRANRLAHHLQLLGAGSKIPVAVMLDRSAEMIVSILAILKAGAIFVPLDASYPAERLSLILQDVQAPILLTKRTLSKALSLPRTLAPIYLDDGVEQLAATEKNLPSRTEGDQVAYIIYTSGSTGQPKGVVVSQYALSNHCLDCRKEYGLSSKDRVLHFSTFNFDASLEQLLPPLISGATVVLRGDEMWNAQEFSRKLREFQLTVTDLPTAYWHDVVEFWSHGEIPQHCLRLMIVGGEAISPNKIALWQKLELPRTRLINAYGPTEATITSSSYEIGGSSIKESVSLNVPIGRPRADRKNFVLDSFGRPVPIGIPGELYIGGTLLARGYHRNEKLTADRFLQNPFSDDPNSRIYRTGDLVRYLEDGNLEFLGRLDDQIKIRGFRIELGEVEVALRSHPAVQEALVIAREEAEGEKRLLAYIKTAKQSITVPELRNYVRTKLPDYMVPAGIVMVKEWPLLPNGKVDRRALLRQAEAEATIEKVSGPREPLELQVQLLFERVLKRAPIGIDQSFFELGGDSLQALELLVQVEKETGKRLPLETLYQASTVESVALEIRRDVSSEEWSSLVPLQAAGSRPPLFLLHTTPGDVLGYGNLVYRLGPDQPCYGLQSRGLKEAQLCHTTLKEMARFYVDLLCKFQSKGPYYLGGWCYGGVVAVEMARLLKARGHEIGLLALLETIAMPAIWSNYKYYLHRLKRLAEMPPQRWMTYAREKARYRRNARLANRMRFRQAGGPGAADDERRTQHLIQLEEVYTTNLKALNRYRSQYYDGKVTLFNASEKDPALIPDPQYGWVGLAKEIEIFEVPGNHDTMLTEPNVSVLARQLNQALRRAHELHEGQKTRAGA